MSIARTVARQCCVCCGVHEELKPGIWSNYRTCCDCNNILHHRAAAVVQDMELSGCYTVQCYMNATLQMMMRSRTWCIHGFIHKCKVPSLCCQEACGPE